jgi:hypothetical protein
MAVKARDRFGTLGANRLSDPAVGGFTFTKSDTDELPEVTRWLYVGGAGDINMVLADGQTVLLKNVPIGLYPLRVKQVLSTDTGASLMVGLI